MPDFESRLAAIEARQLINDDLIEVLKDVRSALRVLVLISKFLKWIAGLVVAVGAAYATLKNWKA